MAEAVELAQIGAVPLDRDMLHGQEPGTKSPWGLLWHYSSVPPRFWVLGGPPGDSRARAIQDF